MYHSALNVYINIYIYISVECGLCCNYNTVEITSVIVVTITADLARHNLV